MEKGAAALETAQFAIAEKGPLERTSGDRPSLIPFGCAETESSTHNGVSYRTKSPIVPPRTIRASPFEALIHHRNIPKDGVISPLRFDELYKNAQDMKEEDEKHVPPPVDEIHIPKPQRIGSSTCSINEDTVPVANCGDSEDYKQLYYSSRMEIRSLRGHLYWMNEENRQLKRSMIEMQKHLYTLSRNKRQMTMNHKLWSIPPSSVTKRRRVEFQGQECERIASSPDKTPSSLGVTMSVSAEENTSDS